MPIVGSVIYKRRRGHIYGTFNRAVNSAWGQSWGSSWGNSWHT